MFLGLVRELVCNDSAHCYVCAVLHCIFTVEITVLCIQGGLSLLCHLSRSAGSREWSGGLQTGLYCKLVEE